MHAGAAGWLANWMTNVLLARIEQDWLSAHTPISGLYLTGQDLVSAGVMGAMIGGFLTSLAIKPQIAWHNLRILANL
jgi:hypothetical protein